MCKSHKICPMLIKKITFLIWDVLNENKRECLFVLKSVVECFTPNWCNINKHTTKLGIEYVLISLKRICIR